MSVNENTARAIMGQNYFGISDANKYFGIEPCFWVDEPIYSSSIPFTKRTLEESKMSHILVAVMDISIRGMYNEFAYKNPPLLSPISNRVESFLSVRKPKAMWLLVRKSPTLTSLSDVCLDSLKKEFNEELVSAQAMVYTVLGHYLATGERLFEKTTAICSEEDIDGNHVFVGLFKEDGLRIYGGSYLYRGRDAVVASARKKD